MGDDGEKRPQLRPSTPVAEASYGDAWGALITGDRQRELLDILREWDSEEDHGKRLGPFAVEDPLIGGQKEARLHLSGADVFWLTAYLLTKEGGDFDTICGQMRSGPDYVRRLYSIEHLNLKQANLQNADLRSALLREAHLEGAHLNNVRLDQADLHRAHLDGAILRRAELSKSHLDKAILTDADLRDANLTSADLRRAQLHGAKLNDAQMADADLFGADLSNVSLLRAVLHNTQFSEANLREATLNAAQGMGANFHGADLSLASMKAASFTRAAFVGAVLEHTDCTEAQLDGANFHRAILRGANLADAILESSCLDEARLEGAQLQDTRLGRVDLRRAAFDEETNLQNAIMCDAQGTGPWLADVRWGGVNLAVVRWGQVQMLADEECIEHDTAADGSPKHNTQMQDELEAAIRANRQLAIALQQEGLEEASIQFTGRTQGLQRKLYRRRGNHIQWFSSLCLDGLASTLAGYGYRPLRSVFAYLATVAVFAVVYFVIGQLMLPHLSFPGALVFSIASFHGRGFFPSPEHASLDHPLVMAAAIEAVIGLIIEITFIAVFTKRFFFGH